MSFAVAAIFDNRIKEQKSCMRINQIEPVCIQAASLSCYYGNYLVVHMIATHCVHQLPERNVYRWYAKYTFTRCPIYSDTYYRHVQMLFISNGQRAKPTFFG